MFQSRRGDDLVAGGVDLGAVVGRLRAIHLAELRGGPATRNGAPSSRPRPAGWSSTGSSLAASYSAGGVLGAGQRAARLHQVEDVVAALDDLGVLRHDELEVRALLAFGDVVQADLVGIAHEVVLGRGLGDRGEDRVLGQGQLVEGLAEVALGRGLHAVALVAVEVLVQVGGDDLLLARLAAGAPGSGGSTG